MVSCVTCAMLESGRCSITGMEVYEYAIHDCDSHAVTLRGPDNSAPAPSSPKPTTLRVRIAVAVTADGTWAAVGGTVGAIRGTLPENAPVRDEELADSATGLLCGDSRITWVEADVYLPTAAETVEGVTFEHVEDEDE